jgi:hypothetical protein
MPDDDGNIIDPNSPIVYMALSILCSNQNSLVPEILYILSPKQIIEFIKVFGGETLRVPTPGEFGRDMMASLACYHILVEKRSWDWIALKYNIDGNYLRSMKNRLEDWSKNLSPSELEFVKSLKQYEKARKAEDSLEADTKVIEWL